MSLMQATTRRQLRYFGLNISYIIAHLYFYFLVCKLKVTNLNAHLGFIAMSKQYFLLYLH